MSMRAKTVKSRVSTHVPQSHQMGLSSRYRVLADAVRPLVERLEIRQLLSASGIGVNFTGGGNGGSGAIDMASTDTGGVIPIANYNNEDGGSQTGVALNNSSGAASGVTMTYTSGGTWNSVGSTITPAGGDQELNDGFVFGNADVQLTGIPYANYDVYVYELNDGAGRVQSTTDVNSGAVVYGSSAPPADANHVSGTANNYLYIGANGATSAAATPTADFAAFSGSTPTFEFKTSVSGGNGYLNGFEIVDHTTTAPVLNTTTVGNNAIALSWTYGANAQSNNFTYTVYRSDASHPAAAIATGVTAQGYTDTTAVNGTAYTYYVVANNGVGPSANSNSLTATASASATLTGVGVNFTGGGNGNAVDMASTDTAGVIPIDNYNNVDGGNGTGIALNDSTGAASTVTLTYTGPGTYNSANSANIPTVTGDQELNNGFVYTNGTTPDDFQLDGVPYANYDVYVYELNDAANRVETTTDINTGAFVVGSSPNPTDANHQSGTVNNYQYIAANGTTAAPTTNADFTVFSGNSTNFEFQAFAPGNGYINGIEIVNHTLTAPTLTSAFPANDAVGLAWTYGNSSANNFTYTIYRSDASHPAAVIASGLTSQTYDDTTAVNGTAYTYYVVANNAFGPSEASNTLSATPFAGPPQSPTGVTATRTGATTVSISYNSSLGATSYDVERGTALNADGSLGGTITDITPGGTTQTTVTDSSALPSGYYAVTASNASGSSAASVAVFVDNGDGWQGSYYSSDTAGTAVYDGDQTAGVAYTQPDGTAFPATVTLPATNPPTNNAVLGFQRMDSTVDLTAAGGNSFTSANPPPNAPPGFNSIEGANPGQDMAIRWVGYIEAPYTGYYTLDPTTDDGAAVTVYDTTHLTGGNPTPVTLQPDNIFVGRGQTTDNDVVVDTTGTQVQWIAGQKYLVQMDYQNQGGDWAAILSYKVSSTAANQTAGTYDLLPQTIIPQSQVLAPTPTFQTIDAANPGGLAKDDPYYTISDIVGPGEIQLNFSNVGADSYNVYRSTSSTGPFTTPIANIPATTGGTVTFNDTGLTNGTTYFYKITGVNDSGETPIASALSISATPALVAPAAPTNLTATRLDANDVALTWGPSVFATSYDVKRGTVLNADGSLGGTIVDVTPGGTTGTSVTDTNAFQRTTYYYQVTASDAGGTSAPSNTATVTATFSFNGLPNAISVNFTGGGNGGAGAISMAPTDTAGVVAEPNYNNVGYNAGEGGGTGIALNDSTGAASTATLTFTGGGTYNSVGGAAFVPVGGDQELNDGFMFGTSTVEIDNIPYANYDVYIYELNDAAGRVETTLNFNTGVSVDGSSANPTDANHVSGVANTYQYIQSTDTTGTNPTPDGDYVLFANQNGSSTFEFEDSAPGNGYLNGFEIVDHPTVAPTGAPVQNPATAGNGSVGLSWSAVSEASSYTVYRTDPAHPTPTIVATNVVGTSYTDTTVTNGTTYTYTIGADNVVGEGPLSNAESATPSAPTLPSWVGSGGAATWNASTHTLTVTGAVTITGDPGTDEPNIVASGAAAKVTITPATSPTNVHVGGITLSGGASLTMTSVGAGRTHNNHNVLVLGTLGSANDPTLSVDSQSKLDLSDNDLIVHTGSSDANGANAYAAVIALAEEGRNPASGAPGQPDGQWNGDGLTSSAAATADASAGYEKIGLGIAVNSTILIGAYSSWQVGSANETLGANDVIVKYDYLADYALEGDVYQDDAGILQLEYDNGASKDHVWATASSLYDGLADNTEAGLMQLQYGLGTGGINGPQL